MASPAPQPRQSDPEDEGIDDDVTQVLSRSALPHFDGYDSAGTSPTDLPTEFMTGQHRLRTPTGSLPAQQKEPETSGTIFTPVIRAFFQGLIEEHQRYIDHADALATAHHEAMQNAIGTREYHRAQVDRLKQDMGRA